MKAEDITTIQELQDYILDKSYPETGLIQGTTRTFDASIMAEAVEWAVKGQVPMNVLTRNFDIRATGIRLRETFLQHNKIH